jgi:zinc D-Ala-D-Ala carboxypeptidase
MMKHFKKSDYSHSDTAIRESIENIPNEHAEWKFEMLVFWLLDPLREFLGEPVWISSGFRSKALNLALKGADGSQHMAEECWVAVDIVTRDLKKAFEYLKQQEFDQLIFEEAEGKRWIHLSLRMDDKNRNEVLKYKNGIYNEVQKPI